MEGVILTHTPTNHETREPILPPMTQNSWLGTNAEQAFEAIGNCLELLLDQMIPDEKMSPQHKREFVDSLSGNDTLNALKRNKAFQETWEALIIRRHADDYGWTSVFRFFFNQWAERPEPSILSGLISKPDSATSSDMKKMAADGITLILKASHSKQFETNPPPDTVIAACILFLYGHWTEATDLHANAAKTFLEKNEKPQHLNQTLKIRFHSLCAKLFDQVFDMETGWFKEEAAPGGQEWLDIQLINFLKTQTRASRKTKNHQDIIDLEKSIKTSKPLSFFTVRKTPLYAPALTQLLWSAFEETKKTPAIRNHAVDDLRNIVTGDIKVDPAGNVAIVGRKKQTVATIDASNHACIDIELMKEIKSRISNVHVPEVLIWMMQQTQSLLSIGAETKVEIIGGWTEFADQLGITTPKGRAQLRSAVETLSTIKPTGASLRRDSGSVTLVVIWDDVPARRNQRAYLRLEIHDGFYKASNGDKMLVPLPSKRAPRYGRQNEWALQRFMEIDTLQYFQERAAELFTSDCVDFTDLKKKLCKEYDISPKYADGLIDIWATGNDREPPFLKKVKPGAYTLAEGREAELDVTYRQHHRREAGRQAGVKSQANKRRAFGSQH